MHRKQKKIHSLKNFKDRKKQLWFLLNKWIDKNSISENIINIDHSENPVLNQDELENITFLYSINFFLVQIQKGYYNLKIKNLDFNLAADDKHGILESIIHCYMKNSTELKNFNIDYSMKKLNSGWKIYDINKNGVSIMDNIAAQVLSLRNQGNNNLMLAERIKDKIYSLNEKNPQLLLFELNGDYQ